MESKLAEALHLEFEPVALILTGEKPEDAMQFKEGKWGCVMWLFASAAKGKTAVMDEKTFGCIGGGTGMGFGNQYLNWPGGIECFYYFLSTGNENWERGRQTAEKIKPFMRGESFEHFVHGEKYVKTPELVDKFVKCLPITQIPARYAMFKPLKDVDPGAERPEAVIFLADPDQLSALIIMANYARDGNENVVAPQAAGCQQLGIYPMNEAKSQNPRAVIGLTDLSARESTRKQLGKNLLTFAMPMKLFEEMESNVEGSFLEQAPWTKLL